MSKISSAYFHSLSFKLIVVLTSVLLIVLTIITIINISVQRRQLLDALHLSAARSSDFIKISLRNSMLLNRRDDVHQSISNLGTEPGVERIRIYNKKGRIMFSSKGAEIDRQVDKDADACIMCHGNSAGFEKTQSDQYTREYENSSGEHLLGLINPIMNEKSCWDAACHAHAETETYLGVLDVQMNMKSFDGHIAESRISQIISSLALVIIVGCASAVFILFVVRRPIKQFFAGTRAIASGNLEHQIILQTQDELGELARSFNSMAHELTDARAELTNWSKTLEARVDEKTRELKRVQAQILHMEKIASLGKLSASIAHELNNPLSGILTFAKLILKRLHTAELDDAKREQTIHELTMIADEAKRCGEIVKNLLFFSRKQEYERKGTDVHGLIEKSVQLIQHKIEMQQIVLEKKYFSASGNTDGDALEIECDPPQIQQAIVALLVNAVEAMPEGGTLRIETGKQNDSIVSIRIADTGCGISEADMSKIFEPFYTTKDAVSGTGLGLSIVYGIARNHGGDIQVQSVPGQYSIFSLTLPIHAPVTIDMIA